MYMQTRFIAPKRRFWSVSNYAPKNVIQPTCRSVIRRAKEDVHEYPKTGHGKMLEYYLKAEPELFQVTVEQQLRKLQEEQLETENIRSDAKSGTTDLVLQRRIHNLKWLERQETLEDLMYALVLNKFYSLRIEMLPRLDGFVNPPLIDLRSLTEGVHSKEAVELIKQTLFNGGPSSFAFGSFIFIKMSKLQMAQTYIASMLFGYFLRRVDARFQLEKAMGTLPPSREDTVAQLEHLFEAAEDIATSSDPDYAAARPVDMNKPIQGDPEAGAGGGGAAMARGHTALSRYLDGFNAASLSATAQMLSAQAAALVERQAAALFDDVNKLSQHLQDALGAAANREEMQQRLRRGVELDLFETVTMSMATHRRAVLEAIAFGAILRDVENYVDLQYGLLTFAPLAGSGGGGGGGSGGGGRTPGLPRQQL